MTYSELTDKLMSLYSEGLYKESVLEAKNHFFKTMGVLDEESPYFEMKVSQFSDWYLHQRALGKAGLTPLQDAAKNGDWPDESKDMIQSLANSRSSLFEYVKSKSNDIFLKDLLSKEKLVIRDSPVSVGFDRDSIFEARLIKDGDDYFFGPSFCFHPPESTKYISGKIKMLKKEKKLDDRVACEELFWSLKKMCHRLEQYRHVAVNSIYTDNPETKSAET